MSHSFIVTLAVTVDDPDEFPTPDLAKDFIEKLTVHTGAPCWLDPQALTIGNQYVGKATVIAVDSDNTGDIDVAPYTRRSR